MPRNVDVDGIAAQMMGNHLKFDSFGWSDRPEDDERWTIWYLGAGRDERPEGASNHATARKALEGADADEKDWREESHNHWAVGHIDGFAVRVRDAQGSITPAFRAVAEMVAALEDYPILDESDYSEREYAASLETLENCFDLSADDAARVHQWLGDNGCDTHPDDMCQDSVDRAKEALGIKDDDEE